MARFYSSHHQSRRGWSLSLSVYLDVYEEGLMQGQEWDPVVACV